MRSGRSGLRGEGTAALWFLAPALLALVLFRLAPALNALWMSIGVGDGAIGLGNYRFLFTLPTFTQSLMVTLIYNVIVNPLQIVVALGLALLLNQTIPLRGLHRMVVFLPVATPLAVASIVWGIAMRPSDGPLNAVLNVFGIANQPFLTSDTQALASIMLIVTWAGVGYWTMFLIAGLQDIPGELYEAATVDGAGWWPALWHITIPMLRRPLAFVLVANTVGNFLIFAPVQILTRGGPRGSTNLFMYEIYQQGFAFGDLSVASAGVVLLVLMMLVFVSVQFWLLRTEE